MEAWDAERKRLLKRQRTGESTQGNPAGALAAAALSRDAFSRVVATVLQDASSDVMSEFMADAEHEETRERVRTVVGLMAESVVTKLLAALPTVQAGLSAAAEAPRVERPPGTGPRLGLTPALLPPPTLREPPGDPRPAAAAALPPSRRQTPHAPPGSVPVRLVLVNEAREGYGSWRAVEWRSTELIHFPELYEGLAGWNLLLGGAGEALRVELHDREGRLVTDGAAAHAPIQLLLLKGSAQPGASFEPHRLEKLGKLGRPEKLLDLGAPYRLYAGSCALAGLRVRVNSSGVAPNNELRLAVQLHAPLLAGGDGDAALVRVAPALSVPFRVKARRAEAIRKHHAREILLESEVWRLVHIKRDSRKVLQLRSWLSQRIMETEASKGPWVLHLVRHYAEAQWQRLLGIEEEVWAGEVVEHIKAAQRNSAEKELCDARRRPPGPPRPLAAASRYTLSRSDAGAAGPSGVLPPPDASGWAPEDAPPYARLDSDAAARLMAETMFHFGRQNSWQPSEVASATAPHQGPGGPERHPTVEQGWPGAPGQPSWGGAPLPLPPRRDTPYSAAGGGGDVLMQLAAAADRVASGGQGGPVLPPTAAPRWDRPTHPSLLLRGAAGAPPQRHSVADLSRSLLPPPSALRARSGEIAPAPPPLPFGLGSAEQQQVHALALLGSITMLHVQRSLTGGSEGGSEGGAPNQPVWGRAQSGAVSDGQELLLGALAAAVRPPEPGARGPGN